MWENLQFGQCIQKKKHKMMFTPEDDPKMWNFIAQNFLNYGPFEVFTKMKEALGYEHADKSLYYRFRNILAPNLHLTSFHIETKLQIAKKFSILLNKEWKQNLHQFMNLAFDSNGCIEDFSWKNEYLGDTIQTTSSSAMLMSLATASLDSRKKRTSRESTSNGCKKPKREFIEPTSSTSSEIFVPNPTPSFVDSLKEIISETVTDSNRKLITEMKASNEIVVRTQQLEGSGLRHYLEGLKGLLNHMNTPELEDIRTRIVILEEKLKDGDSAAPLDSIHSMLDVGLKMIGG